MEAGTTSAPEPFGVHGRSDLGAAVGRTEELYASHARLVSGLCRALLRDRAEAEDAAQQTFLAAHRALLNGTTPREPAAWLATIARNECWSRIRGRMREPLPTDEIDAAGHAPDALSEAIRHADLSALWQAISELPQQQRNALLLREFGGLTYDELAGALAVTGPAVESLLFRARQGLRVRLQTVYAAVSGASLVEALARVLAGASGAAAPAVAKAVVVAGVGAAVATSGAVVAPHVFDRDHTTQHRPASVVTPAAVVQVDTAVPALAPVVHRALVVAKQATRDGEHGSSADGDLRGSSGSSGPGSRDERTTVTEPVPTTASETRQVDISGSSGSSGEGSGSGSELSSGGGGGSSGGSSDSGAGGGTQPSPAVTASDPTGDTTPGSDG